MVEVAAYILRSLSASETRDLTHSIVPVLESVVRDSLDRFSLPKWQAARSGLKRHQAVAELEHLEARGFIKRCAGDVVRYSPLWHSVKSVTAPPRAYFPPFVCVRLLEENEKASALATAILSETDRRRFDSDPGCFAQVPGKTFAYWASRRLMETFTELPMIQAAGFEAWVGLQTNQDFQWLRLWWEVSESACPEPKSDEESRRWLPFAKGGEFAQYYADLHLAVLWESDGELIKQWKREQFRQGLITENNSQCWNASHYRKPGLTWSSRTQSGLSMRVMPRGCIFGHKGPGVFSVNESSMALLAALGIANSLVFSRLVSFQMAFGSFEVGVIRRTPFPVISPSDQSKLSGLVTSAWTEKRALDTTESTSHAFIVPALLAGRGKTLAERSNAWVALVRTSEETVTAIQAEIDDLAFRLYDLNAADRAALTYSISTEASGGIEAEAREDEEEEAAPADAPALAVDLLAYAVGCDFGRWDIHFATGERQPPELPDPFDPLPVCPPGMLQNADGLPAAREDVPADYPLRITWPGILVDEENHPEDIVARVREALRVIWGDRADDIEAEACEILGVKTKPKENLDALRVYFRDPNRFFKDHLARYSKSRRKAPIYWPLSTESGSYTLWIYYHRLDSQTLYTCVSEFIDPKREALGRDLEVLGRRIGTGGSTEERQQLDELTTFLTELKTLRDRLLEVAGLPYRPNLNDGVQITAAPLWKCFRHGPWQKVLKDTWKELEKGKYDWAHLTLPIWPGRVVPLCAKDRSIASAHGLEDLLWVPDLTSKKKDQLRPLKSSEDEIKELIKAGHDKKDVERTATDVQAAEVLGVRGNLWVVQPEGAWRRRLSPKEEIENETKLRRGI